MAEHGPDCECPRCRGFEVGNDLGAASRFERGNDAAVTHGARSEGKLRPVAERYLERLRAQAPTGREMEDEFALERLAWLLARIDAAEQWIDENGVLDAAGAPQPVLAQLSTWEGSARRLMVELGLTANSRARLRQLEAETNYIDAAAVQQVIVLVMAAGPDMARELVDQGLVGEQLVHVFRERFPQLVQEKIALLELPDGREL